MDALAPVRIESDKGCAISQSGRYGMAAMWVAVFVMRMLVAYLRDGQACCGVECARSSNASSVKRHRRLRQSAPHLFFMQQG